jgi:hypothetical protein
MPKAHLRVTLPEGLWIGDLARSFPDATFRVMAALPSGGGGVGLAELTAPDLASVVAGMEAFETVVSVDVLQRALNTTLLQFETTQPVLLFSAQASGIPLEPPVTVQAGNADIEVTASQDRLSELGTQLSAFGLPFEVVSLQQVVTPEYFLTESQRDLLTAAVEEGYYDTPRRCTLTDLADELGMAKSTVSETLHRAEEHVVKQFVENDPQLAFEGTDEE